MVLGIRVPKGIIPSGILPKKRLIPFVDNQTLAIGTGLGLLAAYYAHTQGWINIPFLQGQGPLGPAMEGGTPTGNKISFTISPNTVQPDSQFEIAGQVTDTNGAPSKPSNMYYYVYRDFGTEGQGQGLTKLIASGNLGSLVSQFRTTVSTAGFAPGEYMVAVADEQLPGTGQVLAGSTDIAGQAPPLTSNTVSPNQFGNITIS